MIENLFPRREDATNKELVLTLIDIQGDISRYGRLHTNWHETINEVEIRLETLDELEEENKRLRAALAAKQECSADLGRYDPYTDSFVKD